METTTTDMNLRQLTLGGEMKGQYCTQDSSYYYPYYGYWYSNTNKIEQAFKIVQKLQDKKLIKLKEIKDFIELVNDISEVI